MRRLVAASVLVLVTGPPAFGQRFFGVRRVVLGDQIRWRTSPVGIALQALVVSILLVVTIRIFRGLHPGPYRRKGRRSFLENPEVPFPSADATSEKPE